MDLPHTTHPQLAALGDSLSRSMTRHVVQNAALASAIAQLEFEIVLATEPADLRQLLEPTQ